MAASLASLQQEPNHSAGAGCAEASLALEIAAARHCEILFALVCSLRAAGHADAAISSWMSGLLPPHEAGETALEQRTMGSP